MDLPETYETPPSNSNRITTEKIRSYLNDDFMCGHVSAKDFIDTMLAVASEYPPSAKYSYLASEALQALVIPLGHLMNSSQMATGRTHEIIQQGNDNERTQSLARALTSGHLKTLRNFVTQEQRPQFANEAYWLGLFHAPGKANPEDTQTLCSQLMGEPNSLFSTGGRPIYYPKRLFTIISTTANLLRARPDLMDDSVVETIRNLPERIAKAIFWTRTRSGYGDKSVTMEQITEKAGELVSLCSTQKASVRPSQLPTGISASSKIGLGE